MKYMGSKRRVRDQILPIILKDRLPGQWYVEPFCGGCNVIDRVPGNRIGNDNNRYLIALCREMQKDGFKAPLVSENEYYAIQCNHGLYPDWLVGYAGLLLSFGAKWFGGYSRDKAGHRDYAAEVQRDVQRQCPPLKGIVFYNYDYRDVPIPDNSIIYCDPPYIDTTKYHSGFDNRRFWVWATEMVHRGHRVFVSEYEAPESWECIWSTILTASVARDQSPIRVEKLFTLKGEL